MFKTISLQLLVSGLIANETVEFKNSLDKDLLAHQQMVQRLSKCNCVKI